MLDAFICWMFQLLHSVMDSTVPGEGQRLKNCLNVRDEKVFGGSFGLISLWCGGGPKVINKRKDVSQARQITGDGSRCVSTPPLKRHRGLPAPPAVWGPAFMPLCKIRLQDRFLQKRNKVHLHICPHSKTPLFPGFQVAQVGLELPL